MITTALEETWHDDEPVLFLGEWCRLFSRQEQWKEMDTEVLPYHWDNRVKLYDDYQYLQKFYERLLIDLTAQLNQIHGVEYSLRYWRILIGPWLGYFIQILFDRWTSIHDAIDNYELKETIVLTGNEESFIPSNMTHFMSLIVKDDWNHHIYASILQNFTDLPCVKLERQNIKPVSNSGRSISFKGKIKQLFVTWYTKCASLLTRNHDAFFLTTYLTHFDEIKLQLRMGQVPLLWRAVPAVKINVDKSYRQWNVDGKNHSEFETCVRALISQLMPSIYLEGYSQLTEQIACLPWPKQPKVIWTSSSYSTDDVFKAWAAEKVEYGTPLVIGQHGGGLGTHLLAFYEEHQISICDSYFSWGWTKASQPKIKAVGALKGKYPLGVRHTEQNGILLVTLKMPRMSCHLFSSTIAGQWLDNFNDQCKFVEELSIPIRDALTVRLKVDDYGWEPILRWKSRFPGIRLDEGYTKLNDLISKSRLYISTYNATTFLESFTMNIPTVMYWNPEHWELCESAVPYFNELKHVGIFHETPESAARHVVAIWDDVDGWWNSADVQQALKYFKARYCNLPNNLLDRVEDALQKVIIDSKELVS